MGSHAANAPILGGSHQCYQQSPSDFLTLATIGTLMEIDLVGHVKGHVLHHAVVSLAVQAAQDGGADASLLLHHVIRDKPLPTIMDMPELVLRRAPQQAYNLVCMKLIGVPAHRSIPVDS